MSDYHINIFYSEEDAAHVADIPDRDACSALDHTPEEALNEVDQARRPLARCRKGCRQADPAPRCRPAI